MGHWGRRWSYNFHPICSLFPARAHFSLKILAPPVGHWGRRWRLRLVLIFFQIWAFFYHVLLVFLFFPLDAEKSGKREWKQKEKNSWFFPFLSFDLGFLKFKSNGTTAKRPLKRIQKTQRAKEKQFFGFPWGFCMDFLGNQTRMNFPGNRMGHGFYWESKGGCKKIIIITWLD